MIRTLYRNDKGSTTTDVPAAHWKVALRDQKGLFWVDFGAEPHRRVESLLADVFQFHPLAIEDALQESHVPKIDDWGNYLYAVVHGVTFDPATKHLDTNEIDVFLGKNFLVTHHKNPLASADRVWQACQRNERTLARGADYLLYHILDTVVADYMPVVDQLDDAIDELEDDVFAAGSRAVLNEIFAIKRAVLHLRRIVSPQREVMNRLARDTYAVVDASERIYFRDVYDHLVRLADITDTLRELIGGTLDTYLSASANRTNEIMKVLTVFAVLFMPLTFLTGFFGMNFDFLPFASIPAFVVMLLLTILTPVAMWQWFRSRRWL